MKILNPQLMISYLLIKSVVLFDPRIDEDLNFSSNDEKGGGMREFVNHSKFSTEKGI